MESKQNHYSQLPIFQEESRAEQSRIRQRAPKLKLFINSMAEYL